MAKIKVRVRSRLHGPSHPIADRAKAVLKSYARSLVDGTWQWNMDDVVEELFPSIHKGFNVSFYMDSAYVMVGSVENQPAALMGAMYKFPGQSYHYWEFTLVKDGKWTILKDGALYEEGDEGP